MNRRNPIADGKSRGVDVRGLIERARRQAEGAAIASGPPPHAFCPPGYRIASRLRRGGQGIVYDAIQLSTGRRVALKIMHEGSVVRPYDVGSFRNDVDVLSSLKHTCIVSLLDGGVYRGRYYLVMDFVDGSALDEHLLESAPSRRDRVLLFRDIGRAVCVAHGRGVVHRDLKPSNIRVSSDGRPSILDFGLAKFVESTADLSGVPGGGLIGSPLWAAPEQHGGSGREVDVRTDVYALGLVLYFMLTDQAPGPWPSDVQRRRRRRGLRAYGQRLRSRPEVVDRMDLSAGSGHRLDADLVAIIRRATEAAAEDRYQTADAMVGDLERYLAGEAVEARRHEAAYVLRKTVVKHKAISAIAVAFTLWLAVYGVTVTMLYTRTSEAERQAREALEIARRRTDDIRNVLSAAVSAAIDLNHVPGAKGTQRKLFSQVYHDLLALRENEPTDPMVSLGVARVRMELGNVAHSTGQREQAQTHFDEARRILSTMLEAGISDPAVDAAYSIALVRVGDLLKESGDLYNAMTEYESALAIDERLVEENPANLHYLDQLHWSYDRLGHLHRRLKHAEYSEWYANRQLDVARRLVRERPDHANSQYAIYAAWTRTAHVARDSADSGGAQHAHERALRAARRMVDLDPANMLYRRRLVAGIIPCASMLAESGKAAEAHDQLLDGLRHLEFLDGETLENLVLSAQLHRRLADSYRVLRRPELSEVHARRRIDLGRAVCVEDPINPRGWSHTMEGLSQLAEAARSMGRRGEVRRACHEGIDVARAMWDRGVPWGHAWSSFSHLLRLDVAINGNLLETNLAREAYDASGGRDAALLLHFVAQLAEVGQFAHAGDLLDTFLGREWNPAQRDVLARWRRQTLIQRKKHERTLRNRALLAEAGS